MSWTPAPTVLFEDVTITYDGSDAPALTHVDLSIEEGELALVVGRTGSGKSTLLGAINGLVPHFTGGHLEGRVLVAGRDIATHRPRDLADVVGVVGQDPLAGFVTETVEAELAYGMEQLGLPPETMRRRVEEVLDVMDIADLRDAPLRDLSGGQQQRVAIGAVLTQHPQVIVLDEPTSALDPTAAEDVLAAISRLVHDLSTTVIVAEHRIERVIHHADSVIHVVDGRVEHGPPAQMMITSSVAPPVVELGRWAGWTPLPLSVRDARRAAGPLRREIGEIPSPATPPEQPGGLEAKGVTVRHGRLVAVDGVDLTLRPGTITALMGRNGAGKSSLLWALQGSGRRAAGTVSVDGADPAELAPAVRRTVVGLVPQTPGDLLYLETVGGECERADLDAEVAAGTCAALLEEIAPGIPADRHPRDLSEGQRLALVLAIQLTADPPVLLLDEPTRGLDYTAKSALTRALRSVVARGRTVLLSTHDVEFVAEAADRVVVMADGEVISDGPTADVVTSSPAFAPQVAKVLAPAPLLTVAAVRAALTRPTA
ncbi:ABC transporter ATP-binding protein [Janibacter limosus]|uniref:Energy-coupling factor ABC transporter ATP-binding protein n=1 Tax=Janibacter limosus TaxID=53458 RepID=A0A4P6MQ31_9MICO|nr:ATP-binding cassette domain-containing protein [Janibacter limosus]QBF45514.1 energy-coupling factor ABC transporter ATP-binding protein [Janibacter limosus]